MINGLLLALAASVFTATSSIAQRTAAAPAPGELAFRLRLILFLIRRPVWFLGIFCMILGFVFQVAALRVASLSLVQPVIAAELLIVFAFLALRSPQRVQRRDWVAATGMALGLGAFLAIAEPHGGTDHAPHSLWFGAALAVVLATAFFCLLARVPMRPGQSPSSSRQAALLAVAAGVAFGFVAAVIKELSGHLSGGPYAVFTNWSPYVLLVSGAAAMFLASNAFQAGSLAASQPGLTIVDPLVASLLGVVLFNEHIHHGPWALLGEAVALTVLVASVVALSRSQLVQGEPAERVAAAPARVGAPAASSGPVTAPPADEAFSRGVLEAERSTRRHHPPGRGPRPVSAGGPDSTGTDGPSPARPDPTGRGGVAR
ncbi:MAG TPA: DMT family transporter [Acidimicrobiales bacterium]|nr:DMT family transporter [Acidimicrobiales bacterium]